MNDLDLQSNTGVRVYRQLCTSVSVYEEVDCSEVHTGLDINK